MVDINAERGVLAGVLSYHSNAYIDISDILKVESFYEESHQIIWKVLQDFFEKNPSNAKIDIPTIYATAKSLNLDQEIEKNKDYLKKLLKFPIEKENVRKLAQKVKKLEIIRQYDTKYAENRPEIQSLTGDESITDIISKAEEPILQVGHSISSNNQEGPIHIGANLLDYIQEKINNPRPIGIKTGFKSYDKAIGGGARRGNIQFISARLKMGKSFMTDNIALNVVRHESVPVLVVDTEMPQHERGCRLLANLSGVETNSIEDGSFARDENKYNKVLNAEQYLQTLPLDYVRVVGMPFDQIVSTIRRWIIKKVGFDEYGKTKDCLILIDYFKLMDAAEITKNIAEYQALGFQLMKLHNLVVQYDVACISFVQLNRDFDTAQSDRIEWYCSSMAKFLQKTDDELAENREYNRKIKIEVARHGPGLSSEDYINIKTNFSIGRISEGPTRNEMHNLRTFQTTNTEPVNF